MKAKLQKYLSGSREGFSLVELIIVIAIMAILIGVVALAVLPYLNRSRESKDIQTLNTICSALSSAVATTQVTSDGSFSITGGALPTGDDVADAMKATIGSGSLKLQSKACKDLDIKCVYKPTDNKIYVYVDGATAFDSVTTGYSAADDTAPTVDEAGKYPCIAN